MPCDSVVSSLRRVSALVFTALLLRPTLGFAQSPWERAASNLELHVHRSAGAVARAGRDRHRRPDVHVRRGRRQAPDLRHRVRRRTRALRGAVPRLVVLTSVSDFAEVRACPIARRTARVQGAPSSPDDLGRRPALFFLALLLGAATFNLFYSFLAGLLMFGGLYGFALWATARDPEMLRILLASSQARRRYDPGKHDRVDMEVASW